MHPVEVAYIVTDVFCETETIVTALLHDTIEDTDLSLSQIELTFGKQVSTLVDGVTKLSELETKKMRLFEAESFRKLLLSLTQDVRILIVKLSDRLHNMRTIKYIKSQEKQKRISLETIEIYAPLAERIGIQKIKTELQDLAFEILNKEIRDNVIKNLGALIKNYEGLSNIIVLELYDKLKQQGINAEVMSRKKTPYSVWVKMLQKNIKFEQLEDIIAFRVLVDTYEDCYKALGIIHKSYNVVPNSFQDFISTPKNNGYQSMHTLVIGPMQYKIEIQIRTKQMNDVAEYGLAAHWRYKQKNEDGNPLEYKWVKDLRKLLTQDYNPNDILNNTKLSMYYDQVFCFTPKGQVISLPNGATPVDFAFTVNEKLGLHCVGTKINGQNVALNTLLSNGDQVEILTLPNRYISEVWVEHVVTGKARSALNNLITEQHNKRYVELGGIILNNVCEILNIDRDDEFISRLSKSLGYKNDKNEFFYKIGIGEILTQDIMDIVRGNSNYGNIIGKILQTIPSYFRLGNKKESAVKSMISMYSNKRDQYHLAHCCNPLPGDDIVGIILCGKKVTIHVNKCKLVQNFNSTPELIIPYKWDAQSKSNLVFYDSCLRIRLADVSGSLIRLLTAIGQFNANIINFRFMHQYSGLREVLCSIQVCNLKNLLEIINFLKTQTYVNFVSRYQAS